MKTIEQFAKFGKVNRKVSSSKEKEKSGVIYTRVSGKEQYDKNLSLDVQRKTIQEHADRCKIKIDAIFGGIYESAQTDGRKEFQRMLDYIKQQKGKISHILVYTTCRFSRTGGAAIKLAEDLREKYGVEVLAVTQPTDTSNPSGVFQQNIQFLFAHYDNVLRRQRAVAGMKEKYERGIWVTKVPMGYDIVRTNGEKKIVVNAIGKKLKKAFVWKSEGMNNDEIIARLITIGVPMYKQQMTKIFKNPFYCGLIANSMLNGRIIEGTHEKMISKEIFYKVNEIHEQSAGFGVPHKKEQDEVPLKVFMRCGECNHPYTGYVVKAKGLWYYKCRRIGCKCNRSAKDTHSLFEQLLDEYTFKEEYKEPLKQRMRQIWYEINKENIEKEQLFNQQLREVNKSIDTIEEKHYVKDEMNKEAFDKFYLRFATERKNIVDELAKVAQVISNPDEAFDKAINFSLELALRWRSADIKDKEKLQKLLFPDGIVFDQKNRVFRTERVNVIFLLLSSLQSIIEDSEKGQTGILDRLSLSAEKQGFEPWIPFDRYTHFPGVPLQPLEHLSFEGCKCTYFFYLFRRVFPGVAIFVSVALITGYIP